MKQCCQHDKHGHQSSCACGHDQEHAHRQSGCGCGHEHAHRHDGCGCDHNHVHQHGGCGCDHEVHSGRTLLVRAAITLVLLAIAHFVPILWLAIPLQVAAYLTVGYDILLASLRNIRRGKVFDENFLMTIASLGAMAVGERVEGIMVMLLYQVGEYLQHRAVDQSKANIAALMDVRPNSANLFRDGMLLTVKPEQVCVDDLILVRAGEKIPLDGVVTEGTSAVDASALTGESLPQHVAVGDRVLSGCVNLTGVLSIRVTTEYGQSTVAKILALVAESGAAKARTERFITRFSRWYTPAVCAMAALIAVVPGLVTGEWKTWSYTALTFLVISCPCALVISVPLTFFSGIGGLSRKGILVKGANHLETLAKLDTVAFDKTGTLTQGRFSVKHVSPVDMSQEELLELAAHAEMHSAHPISQSLREAYGMSIDASRVTGVTTMAGMGVDANVDGKRVLCGNARLMQEQGIVHPSAQSAGTVVHVAVDGGYAGCITITDTVKAEAAQAISDLRAIGVHRLVMLTGDNQAAAEDVAAGLGMTEYHASLLPGDKVVALEALLDGNHKVAFVGDGVNDAPVLRRADVGVAMGGLGSDAAIEAADAVIMDDDPGKLALAIRMAKKTLHIARQNIAFALLVKLAVMLLGVLGFANMWLAVFADVGVAMLCILNALRAMK